MRNIFEIKDLRIVLQMIHKTIGINNKILVWLSIGYLYIPLIFFFITWTKWWIAVLGSMVSAIGCVKIVRDFEYEEDKITIGVFSFCTVLFLLLGIGWLSGWTGYCPQASDWTKHNAVLNDLMNKSWPVYYKEAADPSMLTYYIGQYLVPAMFGKLTSSFRIAEIAMYIWGEIGLFLVAFNLFRVLKADSFRKQVLVIIILIFFSGCLILAQQMYEVITEISSSDIRWMTSTGSSLLQYRSNFVDLRWVMPQCLSVWLIITLWWENRDKINDYVNLMIPAFLNGALSFLGLAVIAIICAVIELLIKHMDIKGWTRKIFSIQNILSSFVLGGVLFIYYAGNIFLPKPDIVGFSVQKLDIWLYLSFVLAIFGIYCLLVWKENRYNGIFWGGVLTLLIIPVFRMGYNNDFVMCCSIPGLFVVMICVIGHLLQFGKTISAGILIALLFISALNPMKEMGKIIRECVPGEMQHRVGVESLALYSDLQNEDIPVSWKYNYYSYNVDENFFIKYIAQDLW